MAYTSYPSVAGTSLVGGGSSIAEEYISLWVYSSSLGHGANTTTSGSYLLAKGTVTCSTAVDSTKKLHTLNANWAVGQKFAFEASIDTGSTSGYAALYDFTTSSVVTASQISTTSATFTVVRSGAFTLVPGHVYGITMWGAATNDQAGLSKAHLVALTM